MRRNRKRRQVGRRQLLHKPTKRSFSNKKKIPFKAYLFRIFVIGSLTLFYWFFVSSAFQVKEVKITGLSDEQSIQLKSQVSDFSKGFFKKNYYFISKSSLEKHLKSNMPELKEVTVTKEAKEKDISIKASLRDIAFNWQAMGEKYVVDREGVVVEMGKTKENAINVIDSNNLLLRPGDRVGTPDLMLFIEKVNSSFPQTGYKIVEINITNEFKRELKIKTDGNFQVFFDTTRDPLSQIESLGRVLKEVKKENRTIEYIDLRVENRIFYK